MWRYKRQAKRFVGNEFISDAVSLKMVSFHCKNLSARWILFYPFLQDLSAGGLMKVEAPGSAL